MSTCSCTRPGCRTWWQTSWRRVRRCRTCLRWWTRHDGADALRRRVSLGSLRVFGPRRQERARDRVYLDYNATAPLRPEARAAMIAAMDVVGNPSSVHAEGRAAKALVEQARGAGGRRRLGADGADVVFTSRRDRGGGAGLRRARAASARRSSMTRCWAWIDAGPAGRSRRAGCTVRRSGGESALQIANSETGVRAGRCPQGWR